MNCYKLSAKYVNEWMSSDLLFVTMPDVYTPRRYCSICKITPRADAADIPEAPSSEVVKLLSPYQIDPPKSWLIDLDEAVFNGDDEKANNIDKNIMQFNALPPEEFSIVAEKLRSMMYLPKERLVMPRETVGPATAKLAQPLKVDMIAGVTYVPCPILTEYAAEVLSDSKLSGFNIYPLKTVSRYEEQLYTMIVFGDGGIPTVSFGRLEWKQCPGCGEWWLRGDDACARLKVDEKSWDGSDFFHFAGKGPFYISNRARQYIDSSSLALNVSYESLSDIVFIANNHERGIVFEIIPPPY